MGKRNKRNDEALSSERAKLLEVSVLALGRTDSHCMGGLKGSRLHSSFDVQLHQGPIQPGHPSPLARPPSCDTTNRMSFAKNLGVFSVEEGITHNRCLARLLLLHQMASCCCQTYCTQQVACSSSNYYYHVRYQSRNSVVSCS